uniref:Uncharacterized protein n=1 Tax=Salix viminalis TaxID=40686 RepID=A0A6N2NBQ1_SALVM
MLCCPLHIFDTVIFAPSSPAPSLSFSTAEQIKANKQYTLSRSPILASRLKGLVSLCFFLGSFCYYH